MLNGRPQILFELLALHLHADLRFHYVSFELEQARFQNTAQFGETRGLPLVSKIALPLQLGSIDRDSGPARDLNRAVRPLLRRNATQEREIRTVPLAKRVEVRWLATTRAGGLPRRRPK